MIDTASLRAEMTRYGFTQKQMAESIGISPRTFSNKLKKGVFGSDEIRTDDSYLENSRSCIYFFCSRSNLKRY